LIDGAWLSLVERTVRDREVGGSNPLAPTSLEKARVNVEQLQRLSLLFLHLLV
jgi:hypothetical protein